MSDWRSRAQPVQQPAGDWRSRARPAQQAPAQQGGGVFDYLQGLGQARNAGLFFSGADEITAAMDTAIQKLPGTRVKRSYEENLAAQRQAQRQFAEENPWSSGIANVAGGLANPINTLGAPGKPLWETVKAAGFVGPMLPMLPSTGTNIARGLSMGQQAARGAAFGAGSGAAYGFGEGEGGLGNRLESAATGAAIGGVVGGAAPAVFAGAAKGAQWGADALISRFFPGMQENQALRKAAEALARDGLTPEQAAQRIADMGPEAILADVGKNTRQMAGAVLRQPGEGAAQLDELLVRRQEGVRDAMNVLQGGQAGRITRGVDDLVPGGFTAQDRAGLVAQRGAAARKPYEIVNDPNSLIPQEALAPVLADDFMADIFARVQGNKLYGLKGAPPNQLAVVDAVKKELDDAISAAQRAGRNNEARLLMQRKDALVSVADEAFPEYAQAREVWRNFSDVLDAGDLGRKLMTGGVQGRPDALRAAISEMGPQELEQVRIGAAQAIRDRIGDVNTRTDVTKKLMDIPALEEKVRLVFGDDDMFRRYIGMLQNEREMFETYALRGGSQTTERLAADEALRNDPGAALEAVGSIASNPGNPMNYLRAGVQAARSGAGRISTPEPVRNQLAQLLMSRDPMALNTPYRTQMTDEMRRRLLAQALTQGVATQQGGP